MNSTQILNVNIDILTKEEFLRELESSSKVLTIAKINSEFLLRAGKNEEFRKTLNDADIRVADGVGVLWAAKYLSLPLINIPVMRQLQAICQMIYSGSSLVFYPLYCKKPLPHAFRGADMMYDMVEFAERKNIPIYLFGAPADTVKTAVSKLNTQYSKLKIAGYHDGYDFDNEKVIQNINESKAQMLFVALGSPMQEYWIRDNISRLTSVKIAVGEGGTFNFIAGTYRRAPKFLRIIGLEWLWRLFANKNTTTTEKTRPRRVWKAVPVFIYNTVIYKIKNNGK